MFLVSEGSGAPSIGPSLVGTRSWCLSYRHARYPGGTRHCGKCGGAVTTWTSCPPAASQLAISPVYFPTPAASGWKLIPCMRIRTLHALVATTSRQSPCPLRLPSHSAGNKTNLAKTIRNRVKNGFRNCPFFLPSLAKSHAIQDCVTHSAGVIW